MKEIDISILEGERLYSAEEVAQMLNVETAVVYGLCRSQKLGHIKFPGKRGTVRISKDDIALFQQTYYNPPKFEAERKQRND